MGTSTWPVLWQVSFASINYSFLRENPSWISSRNSINRLLNVWNKCARTTHMTLKEDHSGAGLRGGEELAGGDGRFRPRHRRAGPSKAKASARRVQAGGAGPESGAEPHARPGQEWRRPRGGGAGQQWAGCGTVGRPGRGGVGEPVHRARPARGQRGSWKDTAMQLTGRPARRTGAWTQARGRRPWGTSRPCRCQAQPSSRREGARPAVATCRTPLLHPQLQPRPSPPARPGLRCPPQAQVSPAGCHESRPAEGEADRLSDAVSCPSDNRSAPPERTRSHPFVLRLSGEHKGQAGCRRRSRSRPQSCPSRCCAATTGLCGQGQDPSSPRPADAPGHGALPGTPHLCARGRSGALLPGTPTAPAGTA